MLAAKASLCVRVDALGEETKPTIGINSRVQVEERLHQCEQAKVLPTIPMYYYLLHVYCADKASQWDREKFGQGREICSRNCLQGVQ